jgi:hypothetical protein
MNNKRLIIALGVIGASYAFWRFYLKGKLADKKATKALNDRAMFDANREIIAQTLPQDFTTTGNDTIDIDFQNIG